MKINLNGRNIEVTIWQKDDDEYMYYIGNRLIGSLKTSAMINENIIMKPKSIVSSLEKLGVRIKNENELQNTIENELSAQIKDQIDQLDRSKIKNEANQTDEIDRYIEEQGIERDRIREVRILELKRDKEKNSEEKKLKEENNLELERNKKNVNNYNLAKGQQQAQKTTMKDILIKQTIDIDERANDMHRLREWLGNNIPNKVQEIGVIYSDDRDKMKDDTGKSYNKLNTTYSLIAISKDGTVEPLEKYLPNLKQRGASGDNPTEQKYQVRDDGTVVKDSVLTEYELGNKIIQIDNKEMGRVEMNIGQEAANSRETMGIQMRDSNTIFATDTSTRSVIGEYESHGTYTVVKNLEEVKKHERLQKEGKCNKQLTEDDIDGDERTSSHTHITGIDEAYIKVCARRILENDAISSVYNQRDIENKLREKLKEKKELSVEEFNKELQNLEQEIEDQAEDQAEDQRVIGDVP